MAAGRPGGLDTLGPSRGRGRRGKPAREGGITGAPRPAPPQDDDRSGEGRTDRTESWGTGGISKCRKGVRQRYNSAERRSGCIHFLKWNDITSEGSRRTQNRARKWKMGGSREKRRSDRARRPRPISHHTGKHDVGRGRSYYSAERRNTLCRRSYV